MKTFLICLSVSIILGILNTSSLKGTIKIITVPTLKNHPSFDFKLTSAYKDAITQDTTLARNSKYYKTHFYIKNGTGNVLQFYLSRNKIAWRRDSLLAGQSDDYNVSDGRYFKIGTNKNWFQKTLTGRHFYNISFSETTHRLVIELNKYH